MASYSERPSLFRKADDPGLQFDASLGELGDQLRLELSKMWQALTNPPHDPVDRDRVILIMRRWVSLLERPHFVQQVDNPSLIARFLVELQEDHKALVPELLQAVRAFAKARPLTPEVRRKLAEASRREAELGWNTLVELSLLGLPESLDEFVMICSQSVLASAEIAQRYQAALLALTPSPKGERRTAFRAFYQQPAADYAAAALEALRDAPGDVWEGVALAALGRPKLQAPFLASLAMRPRPELRGVVEQIATLGAFGAETVAKALLSTMSTGLGSGGLPVPLPRPLPWTTEGRIALARLFSQDRPANERPTPLALDTIKGLVAANTLASADLVIELLELLVNRLEQPPIEALFVDVCVTTKQRTVLAAAAQHLFLHTIRNGPMPPHHRGRIAQRAPGAVDTIDARLALYRLALPDHREAWLATVLRHLPDTESPEDDFSLALMLAKTDHLPLYDLLSACTPNQRRHLVKRAAIRQGGDADPAHGSSQLEVLPRLVAALVERSPATLTALIERLALIDDDIARVVLVDLARSQLAPGIRMAAVEALGHNGDRAALAALAQLVDLDSRKTRAQIVARLRARGEVIEGGALELSADRGQLALAQDESASLVTPRTAGGLPAEVPATIVTLKADKPADWRQRLALPPRPLPLPLVLVHLMFGANGWGVLWFNALGLAVAEAMARGPHPWLMLMSAGFIINHVMGGTFEVLLALRHGDLLSATVRVHTSTTRGKHKSTTFHHTLTLLTDTGQTVEHVVKSSSRLDALLDEKHEPVLVRQTKNGRPMSVTALDHLRLARVTRWGTWRLSVWAWSFVGISVAVWIAFLNR